MRPLHYHSLLFFFAFIDIILAQTLTNVTIDNTDPHIAYAGTWNASHVSSRDYGGGHTLSEDPTGSATFSFTGVAVYYLAPKWPYAVNSYVALDGGTASLVDMSTPPTPQDPPDGEESVPADVLWGVTGLTNTVHRVVVTGGPSGYAVVDGFIYTTQEDITTSQPVSTVISTSVVTGRPSSASSTRSTGSPSPTSSDGAPPNTTVIIAVTVGATALCLVLLVGLIVFFVRRRKKSERMNDYLNSSAYGAGGGGGGGGAYSIPINNYRDTTYSAVPLNDVNAYTYPYGANNNNNTGHGTTGQEMGMANMNSRNSRYSAMAYSDGTGSASMASLSAQQMAYAGTAPYGQDAYGMHPVANRALVVPNPDAGGTTGAYNPGQPSAGYDHGGAAGYHNTGYDYSGYYPENQPSGYNAAAAYASAGPSRSGEGRPNQPPSPVSEKARYGGMGYQQPSINSSIREQNSSGGYDGPTIAHPYAGTSEPPPYVAQAGPSSSQRTIPASPPNKKKGFI